MAEFQRFFCVAKVLLFSPVKTRICARRYSFFLLIFSLLLLHISAPVFCSSRDSELRAQPRTHSASLRISHTRRKGIINTLTIFSLKHYFPKLREFKLPTHLEKERDWSTGPSPKNFNVSIKETKYLMRLYFYEHLSTLTDMFQKSNFFFSIANLSLYEFI